MKFSFIALLSVIILTASSCHSKKIYVDAKGHVSIDKETKTVIIKDGGGSEQATEVFSGSGSLTLKIKKEDGDATVDISDNGLFFLNGRNDTIIGSYVHYGAQKTNEFISQETILKSIDSLQQLVENKNVSLANKNYFILPYHTAKITDNTNAIVVAPFHQMTSLEKDGNKDPEVYRFYSIKEIREKIEKQKAMTIAPPEPATPKK